MISLIGSSLDSWLTADRYAAGFERRFAKECFGRRHTLLVNGDSLASPVAFSSLTSAIAAV